MRISRKEYVMKKIKKTLIALCLTLILASGLSALSSCSDKDNSQPGFPKHKITVQSTEECAVSVDKEQAEFAETVTVTLNLKVTDKYVDSVTYNGNTATRRSENTYDFLMGNDDVIVEVKLKPYQQQLSDSNGFATFLTFNPTTLAKNNGSVDLTISLNGSYMTILNWEIKSTNQAALPGSSVKNSYTELTETGAISARTQTANYSNVITALVVSIDTDKIENGKTFLLINLQNGNSSSQNAGLVVQISVAETLVTTKWHETLIFDVSKLPDKIKNCKFNIYVTDYDYVAGSDNKENQNFIQLETGSDGNVEIEIEYVPNRRYYITFWVVTDDGSLTCYRLADTIGSGSSSTGFNQLKNSMLILLSDGQTFKLTVANEIVN